MDRLFKNGKYDLRWNTSISSFPRELKKVLPELLKALTRPCLGSCVQEGVAKDEGKYNTGIRKGQTIK